ncbi:MAG: glycine zipper 2TM domain-containing protein [Candidatus Hydrogenedentota bacterium]|mgnify:CR=1 FL=1
MKDSVINKGTIIAAIIGALVAITLHQSADLLFATETDTAAVQDTSALSASSTASRATRARALTSSSISTGTQNVIPAGSTVKVKIVTHISSRNAKAGDRVEAVTTEAIQVGDRVIPAGSSVTGYVSKVRPAAETRSAAELEVVFTRFAGYPVRLALISPDLDARAAAANRAVDVALVAGGALTGGVIGHQVDHKKGSTIGALGGALAGAAAAANIGANVQLKAGETATLRFEQSLALS